MRGYVFLIESTLALLASVLILLALPLQPHATHKELYSYQVLGDIITLTQNKYYGDVNQFANGNMAARTKLQATYSRIISEMGDYCLRLEAKNRELEVNCGTKAAHGKNFFSEPVTFYDGKEFYAATFALEA